MSNPLTDTSVGDRRTLVMKKAIFWTVPQTLCILGTGKTHSMLAKVKRPVEPMFNLLKLPILDPINSPQWPQWKVMFSEAPVNLFIGGGACLKGEPARLKVIFSRFSENKLLLFSWRQWVASQITNIPPLDTRDLQGVFKTKHTAHQWRVTWSRSYGILIK